MEEHTLCSAKSIFHSSKLTLGSLLPSPTRCSSFHPKLRYIKYDFYPAQQGFKSSLVLVLSCSQDKLKSTYYPFQFLVLLVRKTS